MFYRFLCIAPQSRIPDAQNIEIIEKTQQRFTKTIYKLKDLAYIQRLCKLGALTLTEAH